MNTDQEKTASANQAFAEYDFGKAVSVTEASGWEYTSQGNEWTRKVYVEGDLEDDGPAPRWTLTFVVEFHEDGALKSAYARDDKGQLWGSANAKDADAETMCPNCGQHPVKNHPQTGCLLAALVQVLRDRGEYTEQQLHAIHANCNEDLLWDDIGDIVNRLGNGEFGTQDEAPPEEQTVITMACADEDFAMREFALIGHDAQGKPDYACKHCGWMQSSAAAGAAELLANASWESDEAREEFLAKVATIINEDKATSGLKVFEVTAAGFDGSTDETDDDVIWVAALSQADVEKAIADTGAKLWGEVTHWTPYVFDFTVPGQAAQLATALLEAASEARNKNRPV